MDQDRSIAGQEHRAGIKRRRIRQRHPRRRPRHRGSHRSRSRLCTSQRSTEPGTDTCEYYGPIGRAVYRGRRRRVANHQGARRRERCGQAQAYERSTVQRNQGSSIRFASDRSTIGARRTPSPTPDPDARARHSSRTMPSGTQCVTDNAARRDISSLPSLQTFDALKHASQRIKRQESAGGTLPRW